MSRRVAAVILARDGLQTVRDAVAAVRAQTVPVDAMIAVDNASTDGTVEWLRDQQDVHTVALTRNLGVGAGHNRGWSEARVVNPGLSFLWTLEQDTIADRECLQRLLATFDAQLAAGEKVGAVVPKQYLPHEPRTEGQPFRHSMLTFNGTLLSVVAIGAAGQLREDFFVGQEDREFAHRLGEAGYAIVKDPGASVVHGNKQARRRARPSVLRAYYSNRNEAYLMVHVRFDRFGRTRVLARTIGGIGRSLLRERPKGARVQARVRATLDGIRGNLGEKHYAFLEART